MKHWWLGVVASLAGAGVGGVLATQCSRDDPAPAPVAESNAPPSQTGARARAAEAGAVAPSAVPRPGSMTFSFTAPNVGLGCEYSSTTSTDASGTRMGKPFRANTRSRSRLQTEVLEVKEGAATKVRLFIKELSPAPASSAALIGKPWIIALGDADRIVVTDANGMPAPSHVADALPDRRRHFGKKDRFARLLDRRNVLPGEELSELIELLADFTPLDGVKQRRVMDRKIVFRGVENGEAKVDYTFDLELDFPETMKVAGAGKLSLAYPAGTLSKHEGTWKLSMKIGETTGMKGTFKVTEQQKCGSD